MGSSFKFGEKINLSLAPVGQLDILTRVSVFCLFIKFDLNPLPVGIINNPGVPGEYYPAHCLGNLIFNAGSHHRRVRSNQGNCLTLHVGAHQSSVTFVVSQKRNECRGGANNLSGGNVDKVGKLGRPLGKRPSIPEGNTGVGDKASGVDIHSGVGDMELLFVIRRDINYLVGYFDQDLFASFYFFQLSIRGFDKSVFVDLGI